MLAAGAWFHTIACLQPGPASEPRHACGWSCGCGWPRVWVGVADASVFLMNNYSDVPHLNMGSGQEVSIKELAELVKETVGFEGELKWDSTKPDGTPRKLMDSGKIMALGWKPQISLKDGLKETYKWYIENYNV